MRFHDHADMALIARPQGALRQRRSRRSRGQALAEFALALPILLLLFFAILDLGRAVYAVHTISNAARTGARVAIVDQSLSTDCALIPLPARCAAANQAVGLGITAGEVQVTLSGTDGSGSCVPKKVGCGVTVTVNYLFTAATPIIGSIVGTIDLSSSSVLPLERVWKSS
jgi:Flp pilus assembly protein TadG